MPPEGSDHRHQFMLAAALAISLAGYIILAYFTNRTDFLKLLGAFTVVSTIYFWVLKCPYRGPLTAWLIGALILRLIFLAAAPELSDDYFRFIWDGRLWNRGISPFAYLPADLMEIEEFASQPINQVLFRGLNSPEYFTVYPPISQYVFLSSTYFFPEDIQANFIFMRIIILLAEGGTVLILPKVLRAFQQPPEWALIYAWNPLVILELTGNLHFEAVMILFLILALWFYQKQQYHPSAVAVGLAIGTKLIPLIFLPLLWKRLPGHKLLQYYIWVGVTVLLCFLPILNMDLIKGLSAGLGLYFQKFEFNASIYYLIREIGFLVKGYNTIQTAGIVLAVTTFLLIIWLAAKSGKHLTWPQAMTFALTIYLFLTTTVHPWYIAPLVLLCSFTNFRYPLVWAFLIIFSYSGYSEQGYQENLSWVILEYAVVWIVLMAEFKGWRLPPNLFKVRTVFRT